MKLLNLSSSLIIEQKHWARLHSGFELATGKACLALLSLLSGPFNSPQTV